MTSPPVTQAPGPAALVGLRSWLTQGWRVVHLGALLLVLMLSPSTYRPEVRRVMARHIYRNTAPILVGFTVLFALFSLVLTRIVVTTAESYGLSRYALQVVIRVLVLELIPLTAALFVAVRCTLPDSAELLEMQRQGRLAQQMREGRDPVRTVVLPRVLAGIFATITLAAISAVVALVLAYLAEFGFTLAGVSAYTRVFGQVFSPPVVLIFGLKTLFFSLAVSLMPMASALQGLAGRPSRTSAELRSLVRMFAVLLLIEVASLVGNYY
jgi:phospholipid/cholesterol/gamma-HCH transport system permease protein